MKLISFVLIGGALLAATPTSLLAQVGGCSACETAIRDKLTELDDRTSKTNLLVKTVDRKLDPLAVKVDSIDTRLTAVQTRLDGIAAVAPPAKSAVVIEFGQGVSPPNTIGSTIGGNPITADEAATKFCRSINYASGRALQALQQSAPNTNFRDVVRLVCFM